APNVGRVRRQLQPAGVAPPGHRRRAGAALRRRAGRALRAAPRQAVHERGRPRLPRGPGRRGVRRAAARRGRPVRPRAGDLHPHPRAPGPLRAARRGVARGRRRPRHRRRRGAVVRPHPLGARRRALADAELRGAATPRPRARPRRPAAAPPPDRRAPRRLEPGDPRTAVPPRAGRRPRRPGRARLHRAPPPLPGGAARPHRAHPARRAAAAAGGGRPQPPGVRVGRAVPPVRAPGRPQLRAGDRRRRHDAARDPEALAPPRAVLRHQRRARGVPDEHRRGRAGRVPAGGACGPADADAVRRDAGAGRDVAHGAVVQRRVGRALDRAVGVAAGGGGRAGAAGEGRVRRRADQHRRRLHRVRDVDGRHAAAGRHARLAARREQRDAAADLEDRRAAVARRDGRRHVARPGQAPAERLPARRADGRGHRDARPHQPHRRRRAGVRPPPRPRGEDRRDPVPAGGGEL
ncbi:MAG: Nicotinate-nucleotide adenylyltransferase / NAD kinase, partial [uncultured Phycisphaerae bacterium]